MTVGGSVASGIMQSNAAGAAGREAQQAAAQGNQLLGGIEQQSTGNLQPFVNTGQGANTALGGLLGLNGDAAAGTAFKNYLGSTNYQFQLGQGLQGVEYANAPQFQSGATGKALNNYAQGMAGSALSGYEGMLGNLSGQGIQAGGILGQLGNQNAGLQSSNLMQAAGIQGLAGLGQANAWSNALQGVTSGLSSFGNSSAMQGMFGGNNAANGWGSTGVANAVQNGYSGGLGW